MLDRGHPAPRRPDDDGDDHLEQAVGPWNEGAEQPNSTEPRPPPRAKNCGRPRPSHQRLAVSISSSSQQQHNFLPVLPGSSPRLHKGSKSRQVGSTPMVDAYRALVEQTQAMELALSARSETRHAAEAALRQGIANLAQPLVDEQKRLLRVETLKNEVDIFQQHLDPFIYEIQSDHEHEVRSSVYRHFTRMRAIQDLGVPIYGIGAVAVEADDKVLMARTSQRLYRRIRRRNATQFSDTDLIPRPAPRKASQSQQQATSPR